MGGEKSVTITNDFNEKGSPPHGRGKAARPRPRLAKFRITPAWAGKRFRQKLQCSSSWDHPRMGGEKSTGYLGAPYPVGSPPHGRGKVTLPRRPPAAAGITPAWAGKRLKRSHRSGIFISGPIPFHSVLHRPAGSGDSRAGRGGSPAGQPQNAGPA